MTRRRRRRPWYHRVGWGTWVLLGLLLAASASLAMRTFWQARAAAPRVEVQVLNGTGVNDLARRVATRLREQGLDVVGIDNADSDRYERTLILLRRGDRDVLQRVVEMLGCGEPLEQRDPTLLVDVTVILGREDVDRFSEALATR